MSKSERIKNNEKSQTSRLSTNAYTRLSCIEEDRNDFKEPFLSFPSFSFTTILWSQNRFFFDSKVVIEQCVWNQ